MSPPPLNLNLPDPLLPYILPSLCSFYRLPLPPWVSVPGDLESCIVVTGGGKGEGAVRGVDKVLREFQGRGRRRKERARAIIAKSNGNDDDNDHDDDDGNGNGNRPNDLQSLLSSPFVFSFLTCYTLLTAPSLPPAVKIFASQSLYHRFQRMEIYDAIDVPHPTTTTTDSTPSSGLGPTTHDDSTFLFESTAGPQVLALLIRELALSFRGTTDGRPTPLHKTLSLAACGLLCRCDCLGWKRGGGGGGGGGMGRQGTTRCCRCWCNHLPPRLRL